VGEALKKKKKRRLSWHKMLGGSDGDEGVWTHNEYMVCVQQTHDGKWYYSWDGINAHITDGEIYGGFLTRGEAQRAAMKNIAVADAVGRLSDGESPFRRFDD